MSVTDTLGRPLAHIPWGRYTLAPGECWLMSTHIMNSWDSRYFGPVTQSHIISAAQPLLTWGK